MQRKIEGILIRKTPFMERHLIGKILLNNGKKVSVVFHGGRGGGRNKRSSILEVGFHLAIDLNWAKKTQEDLYTAKEWTLGWHHDLIRGNYEAFGVACFFLEVADRLAVDANLHEEELATEDLHEDGPYRVLSNALFYLEKSIEEKKFSLWGQGALFLGKLLFNQGISPQAQVCFFCERDLQKLAGVRLLPTEGGFACKECLSSQGESVQESRGKGASWVYPLIREVQRLRYQDYAGLTESGRFPFMGASTSESLSIVDILWKYLCYQSHWELTQFKTYRVFQNPKSEVYSSVR